MNSKKWLIFAVITTVSWGLWGALSGLFANDSLPSTMVYLIWALTMIPPCLLVLLKVGWTLETDKRSIVLGLTIGLLGSGGQMLLFYGLTIGPAYLIFPLISLSPIITIALSMGLLKERTGKLGALGIVLALVALPMFEYSPTGSAEQEGALWFVIALLVMAAWGLQAFFMKFSNSVMSAESIFFYMTISGVMLIPIALMMTDFSAPMDLGLGTLFTTASIQILNSIGALCLVYAFRYGKAIVVSPLTNAGAPLISSVLTILLLGIMPASVKIIAISLALLSALILAIEPEDNSIDPAELR